MSAFYKGEKRVNNIDGLRNFQWESKSLQGKSEDLLNKLETQGSAQGKTDPAALKRAAREFEAVFIGLVIQKMRDTIPKSGFLDGGFGEEVFTSLMDQEFAKGLAQEAGGQLADALVRQLMESHAGPGRDTPKPGGSHPHQEKTSNPENLLAPVQGRISSHYGYRNDPFTGERKFHGGIDLAAPGGSRVHAALDGQVEFSGWAPGYGNLVVLKHPGGYTTLYGHNEENLVSVGEPVAANQVIARVGSTGRSTGPHTHFEVRFQGKAVDPLPYLTAGHKQRAPGGSQDDTV